MKYRLVRPRGKLPDSLANCLRLHGFNWRPKRSLNGKLWDVYKFGLPRVSRETYVLHSDTRPDHLLSWCCKYERLGPGKLYKIISLGAEFAF